MLLLHVNEDAFDDLETNLEVQLCVPLQGNSTYWKDRASQQLESFSVFLFGRLLALLLKYAEHNMTTKTQDVSLATPLLPILTSLSVSLGMVATPFHKKAETGSTVETASTWQQVHFA